jgi:hypothetical protein
MRTTSLSDSLEVTEGLLSLLFHTTWNNGVRDLGNGDASRDEDQIPASNPL